MDCRVRCFDCTDDKGVPPRLWRYLCEDCAEEMQGRHRRETGHAPELVVTKDSAPTGQVYDLIRRASVFPLR